MSSTDKSARSKTLSVWVIVLAGIAWAFAALIFFLLFSVAPPNQPRPDWYSVGTTIFELVPNIAAAWLCWRNWRSPQIVSGRSVWLGIGLGAFSYFIGNLLFTYWEVVLGLDAAVSPGDAFFILAYIFYILGMSSAVRSRRLNLEIWQWGVVSGIAIAGVALAIWLYTSTPSNTSDLLLESPASAQAVTPAPKQKAAKPLNTKPIAAPSIQPTASPSVSPTPTASVTPAPTIVPSPSTEVPTPASPSATESPQPEHRQNAPQWALELEKILAPFEGAVALFYLVCDVILLVLAAMLLLAFWGGRFSQSWRMIASAAVSLYIADMWFKYASTTQADYKSGSLPEVFWVFSTVLFGIGAALEFDLSSRSRRSGSRRRS